MKIRTKAQNFGWKSGSGRTGLWRENMMLTLRSIQFCHANNKQVIMRCCSVQLGINRTRDVWKFTKLDSPKWFWEERQKDFRFWTLFIVNTWHWKKLPLNILVNKTECAHVREFVLTCGQPSEDDVHNVRHTLNFPSGKKLPQYEKSESINWQFLTIILCFSTGRCI
jgi:hypothetical protein